MRSFTIPFTILVLSIGAAAAQSMTGSPLDEIDSWPKGNPTNGMACAINLAPDFEKGSPIFYVNIINNGTNSIFGILRTPIAGRANITLLDAAGKEVPRTTLGNSFGVWSDQKIKEWFETNRENPNRSLSGWKSAQDSKGIMDILFPQGPTQVSGGVSLPQLFELHKPGKYTLSLQLRVAQAKRDKSDNPPLEIFWLPTLVTQIPVSAEEITAATNSPGQ